MNKLQILFENDEIRIINKPSGLAVQGGRLVAEVIGEVAEAGREAFQRVSAGTWVIGNRIRKIQRRDICSNG